MNPSESNIAIVNALRAALSAKITAAIKVEAIDDDADPDGYVVTLTVMVDGFGDHHGADLAAAAADLERRVAEAIEDRAKIG